MKGIGLVGLFPGICLAVALLSFDSARISSKSMRSTDLNQSVEATQAEVAQSEPAKGTENAAAATAAVEEKVEEKAPATTVPAVSVGVPAKPDVPAAPEEIKIVVSPESEKITTTTVESTPEQSSSSAKEEEPSDSDQEKESSKEAVADMPSESTETSIAQLVNQMGALVAKKASEKVYGLIKDRVHKRLEKIIQEELDQIIQSCLMDMERDAVETQKEAVAAEIKADSVPQVTSGTVKEVIIGEL